MAKKRELPGGETGESYKTDKPLTEPQFKRVVIQHRGSFTISRNSTIERKKQLERGIEGGGGRKYPDLEKGASSGSGKRGAKTVLCCGE